MSLHIYKNKKDLANELATQIVQEISFHLLNNDRFSFVLSGGSTPQLLYKTLAENHRTSVDWRKVDFFWGDERCVPFDDPRNNAFMASQDLLNSLNIPDENIYRINTLVSPEIGAQEYEEKLKAYLNTKNSYTFDFCLLGMGSDGHTLSVFPGSPLLNNSGDWVQSIYNKNDGLQRITLLPLLVNQSKQIVFLVNGKDKAETLKKVINGSYNPSELPAQIIKSSNVQWFLDEDAASGILL